MQEVQEQYMARALQLAKYGLGATAPNPMVGAVLVYDDKIIGEGYHRKYGEAHAEVNCINSVGADQKHLVKEATLYVTLEPCSHYGKTPPCSDLLIKENVPKIVIGTTDPFPQVSGSGIRKLTEAGIDVITGVKEKACRDLNTRFFTFHNQRRPYIILKWAQSSDGYISLPDKRPVKISNRYTDRIVHRWRSEEMAILIGSQTALSDNPRLTNRLWSGASPKRLVIDRKALLTDNLHLLKDDSPTLIFNLLRMECKGNKEWIRLEKKLDFLDQVMSVLYERNMQSVLIEGGATLLQTFIDKGLWDEARIITARESLHHGIAAPQLTPSYPCRSFHIEKDNIEIRKPLSPHS